MRARVGTPALWILAARRRPSPAADAVEAERRAAYTTMSPGDRLARALELSSFALKLHDLARRPSSS